MTKLCGTVLESIKKLVKNIVLIKINSLIPLCLRMNSEYIFEKNQDKKQN